MACSKQLCLIVKNKIKVRLMVLLFISAVIVLVGWLVDTDPPVALFTIIMECIVMTLFLFLFFSALYFGILHMF
jgi:hypothetical protein